MKKSVIFLCAVLCLSTLTFAQTVKVVSNEPVPLPTGVNGYNPVISPAGDFILITGGDLKGLQRFDLVTHRLTTLSTANSAGVDAKITDDGKTAVFRASEYIGRLRYTSLKSVNLATGRESTIVKPTRDLEGFGVKDGTVLAIEKGALKTKKVSGKKLATTPAVSSIKQGQLYLTNGKQTRKISPAEENVSYLWSSVSPDGNKLLYYVIEHGKAYVSDLDGKNPVSLGTLRAPRWVGNEWVVGMVDFDNGEIVTSSKIVLVGADGQNRTDLTDSSVIASNPTGSSDASKIVYNTADGQVFLMKLDISK
jgi:Tol biopolymer transport system component